MPDFIQILQADHREVEELFAQYKSSPDPAVVHKICTELKVHTTAEERVVYPVLASDLYGGTQMKDHAEHEHREVNDAIAEIERRGYTDSDIDPFVQTIMTGVREHVQEEENEVFPKMRMTLGEERRESLGAELERVKQQLQAEEETGGALIDLTKAELYEMAKEKKVAGRGSMTKDELIGALKGSS